MPSPNFCSGCSPIFSLVWTYLTVILLPYRFIFTYFCLFSDERSPSQPLLTNLSGGPESVAHQRTAALHRGQHLCIPLDELKPLSHKKKSNIFSFTDGKHALNSITAKLYISKRLDSKLSGISAHFMSTKISFLALSTIRIVDNLA